VRRVGKPHRRTAVRSGVGHARIADRDIVELTNFAATVLFTEDDVKRGIPKALAAAERLAAINSDVTVDPRVVDVDANNIEDLLASAADRQSTSSSTEPTTSKPVTSSTTPP